MNILETTLTKFGINAKIQSVIEGPIATTYEIALDVSKLNIIEHLQRELALAMKAYGEPLIRPIYEKGIVSIEFPKVDRQTVSIDTLFSFFHFQTFVSFLNALANPFALCFGGDVVVDAV